MSTSNLCESPAKNPSSLLRDFQFSAAVIWKEQREFCGRSANCHMQIYEALSWL